jgi:ParB family chromosome partitioning protein
MERSDWSEGRLGRELGVTQSNVSKALKLLGLPEQVRQQVEQGALSPATAYEITKLARAEDQVEVAGRAVSEGLRRGEVRSLVREMNGLPAPKTVEFRVSGGIVTVCGAAVAGGPEAIRAVLLQALGRFDAEDNHEQAVVI